MNEESIPNIIAPIETNNLNNLNDNINNKILTIVIGSAAYKDHV